MQRPPEAPVAGAAFWRFSLALYARAGVADALIALQDKRGLNVNLILFALWLGATQGGRLDTDARTTAGAAIAPADQAVVQPVRALRRELIPVRDPALQALRRRIAGLELAAERHVQRCLAASLAAAPDAAQTGGRWATAMDNLTLCLGDAAALPEAAVLREALKALMRRSNGTGRGVDEPPTPGDDGRSMPLKG